MTSMGPVASGPTQAAEKPETMDWDGVNLVPSPSVLPQYSGLGYDVVPALRAAWKRGVDNNESGFDRARELAVMTYDSQDSDLLPNIES